LNFNETLVQSVFGHQVVVNSPLNDETILNDDNFVGVLDRAQSMGNNN
jgi:hypothetical protein